MDSIENFEVLLIESAYLSEVSAIVSLKNFFVSHSDQIDHCDGGGSLTNKGSLRSNIWP